MKPLRNNVLLLQKAAQSTTASGLVLMGDAEKGIKQGVVVSVGDEVKYVKEGDFVVPDWSKGKPTTYQGQQAAVISEDDILAIIEE